MNNLLKQGITLSILGAFLFALQLFAFTGPPAPAGIGSGAIGVDSSNNLSIGTSAPRAETKFLIVASSTDTSNFAFKILQSNQNPIFVVRNDGNVGIGTVSPNAKLEVLRPGNSGLVALAALLAEVAVSDLC